MFNSPIIEIAIGLILLYLVLGLICTSVNEFLAQLLSLRSENLADAIHGLFTGPDRHRIAEDILQHPLVQSLSRKQLGLNLAGGGKFVGEVTKLPSSIPATTFSIVLTDLLSKSLHGPEDLQYDKEITDLLSLLGMTSINKDVKKVEEWYDGAMERASGWYKRKTQVLSFLVSFAIVIVINADTLVMVDRLSNSPQDRAKIAAYASQVVTSNSSNNAVDDEDRKINVPTGLQETSMSFMGWTSGDSSDPRKMPENPGGWVLKIFGLSLSAFAAALGAPFWFDILSKVMTVRTGGSQPSDKNKKVTA